MFLSRTFIVIRYLPRLNNSSLVCTIATRRASSAISSDTDRKVAKDGTDDKSATTSSSAAQLVDFDKLPRAQQRFVKEFEERNTARVAEIFRQNYRKIVFFAIAIAVVVSIYLYTIFAVKQETFLEEIDEEMAAENAAAK